MILREALVVHHRTLAQPQQLGELAEQLALPLGEYSEGLTMALADFEADAWGQELDYLNNENGEFDGGPYWVGSAGDDGLFDTMDDVDLFIEGYELADTYDFGQLQKVYYLKRRGDDLWMYTRILPDSPADPDGEWGNSDPGETLYENYRGVPLDADFQSYWWTVAGYPDPEPDWQANIAALESVYETFVTDEDPEPLVIQIFEPDLLAE